MGITNAQIREFQEFLDESNTSYAALFKDMVKKDQKKAMDAFANRVKILNDTIQDQGSNN